MFSDGFFLDVFGWISVRLEDIPISPRKNKPTEAESMSDVTPPSSAGMLRCWADLSVCLEKVQKMIEMLMLLKRIWKP